MTVPSRRRFREACASFEAAGGVLPDFGGKIPRPEPPKLFELAGRFARIANIIDALPTAHYQPDDLPLIEAMPGSWPTVGDVRRLRDELVRLGWKP